MQYNETTFTFIILTGLAVSLVGASFIASKVFKSIWKSDVTLTKLTAFLTTFVISFALIISLILWIITANVPFGR